MSTTMSVGTFEMEVLIASTSTSSRGSNAPVIRGSALGAGMVNAMEDKVMELMDAWTLDSTPKVTLSSLSDACEISSRSQSRTVPKGGGRIETGMVHTVTSSSVWSGAEAVRLFRPVLKMFRKSLTTDGWCHRCLLLRASIERDQTW